MGRPKSAQSALQHLLMHVLSLLGQSWWSLLTGQSWSYCPIWQLLVLPGSGIHRELTKLSGFPFRIFCLTIISKQAAFRRVIWSEVEREVNPGIFLANSTIFIIPFDESSVTLSHSMDFSFFWFCYKAQFFQINYTRSSLFCFFNECSILFQETSAPILLHWNFHIA